MRNIINDGVAALARNLKLFFRLFKSENLPEISLFWPQSHHSFYQSCLWNVLSKPHINIHL